MDAIRLETDGDFIECPQRGPLHVEYCLGCAQRLSVEHTANRTVVVCEPGDEPRGALWEPLRSPPSPFRLYDD